jgi:hypothetical protein
VEIGDFSGSETEDFSGGVFSGGEETEDFADRTD